MAISNLNSARIAVLGSGSWGATLTWLLAEAGREVRLWSHDKSKAELLQRQYRLDSPLLVNIPRSVRIFSDLRDCIDGVDLILFCCTAQTMRQVGSQVKEALAEAKLGAVAAANGIAAPVLISAAKGIELHSFSRMSVVLSETVPGALVCALSGPNLAAEILRGLPAASAVACQQPEVARFAQELLSVRSFRVYSNDDIAGVELGGALKNIHAIAAGVVDGLDLGTNAKAALMTRGLVEMTRFAVALGAKPATLSGLSGVGDLVATCYSSLSRNYRLGYRMAKGDSLVTAEKEVKAVAEGVTTTKAVCELSQKLGIELPIAEQVDRTLRGDSTPEKAIMTLMARPLVSE